jgi:hypothetical protein
LAKEMMNKNVKEGKERKKGDRGGGGQRERLNA